MIRYKIESAGCNVILVEPVSTTKHAASVDIYEKNTYMNGNINIAVLYAILNSIQRTSFSVSPRWVGLLPKHINKTLTTEIKNKERRIWTIKKKYRCRLQE
jgi:hypothetical protein